MKELVLWITKTLIRWKALFCGEMEEKLMLLIQKLEMKAASSPGIGWGPLNQQTSEYHLSVQASSDVTPRSFDDVLSLELDKFVSVVNV